MGHKHGITCQARRPHERALAAHVGAGDKHGAGASESQCDVIGDNYTGGGPVGEAGVPDVLQVDDAALPLRTFRNKLGQACGSARQPLHIPSEFNFNMTRK